MTLSLRLLVTEGAEALQTAAWRHGRETGEATDSLSRRSWPGHFVTNTWNGAQ
jgi:hypothetical protein